jgi:hypothetical protein
MNAAEALEKLIPRWRAKMLAREEPEFLDGFIRRNRSALEGLVERALMQRNVKRGIPPQTPDAWAAYRRLVQRERKSIASKGGEAAYTTRLERYLEAELLADTSPEGQESAYRLARTYVYLRAEAILLNANGQEAEPLLLRRPALALLNGDLVVAVRDADGFLHLNPATDADALRPGFAYAHQRVFEIRDQVADSADIGRYATSIWSRVRADVTPSAPTVEIESPPDLKDKPWRTEANLQAMRLVMAKEPGEMTSGDLQILTRYSGWGGLSIDKVQDQFPADLVPESFGLIHEYYTPTVIADSLAEVLCPFLPELAGRDGIVRALEPSAGIGRLIRAFTPRRCLALEAGGQIKRIEWTAVEFSKVSSTLLRALRGDINVFHMPFERWVREEGSRYHGTLGLILSNPPYGERGAFAREDRDEFYFEKRAYAYFMRRALDLLIPGGIGVFLIPAGFVTGKTNRPLREKILLRHHFLGAYRLPSHDLRGRENVPGAGLVMDIVFWRNRGGELRQIDEADTYILDGDYFERHPSHILGAEDGAFAGDEGRSWRYKVTGELRSLPPLDPRPICTACVIDTIARSADLGAPQTVLRDEDEVPSGTDDALRPALELGRRVGRYLAAVGADDAPRAAALWPELHAALVDLAKTQGNPRQRKDLRALADNGVSAAERILNAYTRSGELIDALRAPPVVEPKYTGQPDDVVAQAELLFRQRRHLNIETLHKFHLSQGGSADQADIVSTLVAKGWALDGEAWDELLPEDAYLTGIDLWAKHDRAQARAQQGDLIARSQVNRLLAAIDPVVFDDLTELRPNEGWVPIDVVADWLTEDLNSLYSPLSLIRADGLYEARTREGGPRPVLAPATAAFLGWLNHDLATFTPPKRSKLDSGPRSREDKLAEKRSRAEERLKLQQQWSDAFRAWVARDDDRQAQIVHAYNRSFRGRIVPTYPAENLEIARWGPGAPKLKNHQIAGARRVLAQRGGLVAFDVGVGKTYTALAIVARARQEGWVRRPVILVPGSIAWKWHDDILCTLPDYRVAVIGSKRKIIGRGARKGLITSEPESPEERAQKWIALQTGQLDVVILTYEALARTKVNTKPVMAYIKQVEAIERTLTLRRRRLQEQDKTPGGRDKMTDRQRALLEHGTRAWVEEILALPDGWEYDPGVAWDEIGIDMLVVDEAASFKNLYLPQPREDGGIPKFMGGSGDGSNRAWQLDFRAAMVRRQTGGAGVVLLTATPAKNSPLELYNLIQFIDPTAFYSAGIYDPEQFIDRFIKIELRDVLTSDFKIESASAVTGFRNLDDLRTIIFSKSEFRSAAEVGLQLPRPIVETVTVAMDELQEAKYDRYVREIERILAEPAKPDSGPSNVIVGLLARLSLVALHSGLDEGYNLKNALDGGVATRNVYDPRTGEVEEITVTLPRPIYESPKLTACAERIVASPHCGHIIFVEPTAVHMWMREVLVANGIPRERIAILNSEVSTSERATIAREFNGLGSAPAKPGACARPSEFATAPKYDIVIANSVAYEGIDLQVRTCAIHHVDLTWTPADLEQRNGRGVRQGNTLGLINIYYYFADGSTDGYRFSLIDGKAGWLGQLLTSAVRDTNNPGAQQQLSPEDVLIMISRDKEKTRALIEMKRSQAIEAARARIAREANRVLRQAVSRFDRAREADDPEHAARLREDAEQRLSDLKNVDPAAWPWYPWIHVARDVAMLVPELGAPVYEGLRVTRPRVGDPSQLDHFEFGAITDASGPKIGLRLAGSATWQLLTYEGDLAGKPLDPAEFPREGGPVWPLDDEDRTAAAIALKLGNTSFVRSLDDLGWLGASDAFLAKWWPRFNDKIAEAFANAWKPSSVPVVDSEGLAITAGADVRGARLLPPTLEGWREYLALAPASGESYTTLRELGLAWWRRKIPKRLLADAADADDADNAEDNADNADNTDKPSPPAKPSPSPTRTPPPARGPVAPSRSPSGPGRLHVGATPANEVERLREGLRAGVTLDPGDDRTLVDNLTLRMHALSDAGAFGASREARKKIWDDGIATALEIVRMRAAAYLLQARGHDLRLHSGGARPWIGFFRDGELLAALEPSGLWTLPGLDQPTLDVLRADAESALETATQALEKHRKTHSDLDGIAFAVWNEVRPSDPPPTLTTTPPTSTPSRPAAQPAPSPVAAKPARTAAPARAAAPPALEPTAHRPDAHEPTLLQRAEAIEIRQLQGIAAHEQGLHKLALALKELIEPIPKTPAEISRYFSMEEDYVPKFWDIASEIDDYIAQGGPVGGTLERIAGLLQANLEADVVQVEGGVMTVPSNTIRTGSKNDNYVLRQEPEGFSRHGIEVLGPQLDEDGEESAWMRVKPLPPKQGVQPLRRWDGLIHDMEDEEALTRRWAHYDMLAQALRRAPRDLEGTRKLIAYASVLVAAPKCRGRARAVAARALEQAIDEHKAAAAAIEAGHESESAKRLTRVAKHLARVAHEIATHCAAGQTHLPLDPGDQAPENVPEPGPAEEQEEPADAPDDPYELTPEDRDFGPYVLYSALQSLEGGGATPEPKGDPAKDKAMIDALGNILEKLP